jgi:hypothetical protein
MKLNIPNFLIPEQKELARLLKDMLEQGYSWKRDSLKCINDVYHCKGQIIKNINVDNAEERGMGFEGYCDVYNTKVEGMTRAEIAAILLGLSEFGFEIELTGDAPIIQGLKTSTQYTNKDLTYSEVMRCTSVHEVLHTLRISGQTEKADALVAFQEREVSHSRRLTVKKAAEFLFPKRPAKEIQPIGRPSEAYKRSARSAEEAMKLLSEFSKIGITETSYAQKVSAEIRQNFNSLALLCANAPKELINEIKLSS